MPALAFLCAALLCGCSVLRENNSPETLKAATDEISSAMSSDAASAENAATDGTPASAEPDEIVSKAAAVALYDDIGDVGIYTRLDTWECSFDAGVDLAVFDLLPSDAQRLEFAGAYRELWTSLSRGGRVSLVLEYTAGAREFREELSSWEDAERVNAGGYIEVYLYDDVHHAAGEWYSHLTAADTTDETVLTSVKLTGGAKIDEVERVRLTAYLDGVEGGSVSVLRK